MCVSCPLSHHSMFNPECESWMSFPELRASSRSISSFSCPCFSPWPFDLIFGFIKSIVLCQISTSESHFRPRRPLWHCPSNSASDELVPITFCDVLDIALLKQHSWSCCSLIRALLSGLTWNSDTPFYFCTCFVSALPLYLTITDDFFCSYSTVCRIDLSGLVEPFTAFYFSSIKQTFFANPFFSIFWGFDATRRHGSHFQKLIPSDIWL